MQRLVQRLHENDEAAFEDIYNLIHQKIYCFILRYIQDSSNARELTQRFFVRLWENRHRISAEKPLEAQAFVIARNLVIDELRKKAREKNFIEYFRSRLETVSTVTEETILYDDLQTHLEAVVESLPQRRREIFKLSRHQGLTYQEIARELSISPKTVEIQMSKALKVVRSKLSSFLHLLF